MPHTGNDPPLIAMLRALTEAVGDREKVLLGELTDALGTHGFGPVILFAAAIMMLPTGVIPFVPAFMALLLAIAAAQMLRGRRDLWLPPRLYGIQLPGQALRNGLARAAPVSGWLGRVVQRRLVFLAESRVSLWAIGAILIVTSGTVIVVGAIPGLPFLLAMHVLAFGIGLTAGDGLFIAAGYAIFFPAAWGGLRLAGLL